jgi:hypothetical protein
MIRVCALVLCVASVFSKAESLKPLENEGMSQLVSYGHLLAQSDRQSGFSGEIRIFVFPVEVGECWGTINSCPDVRLAFALTSGDMYADQEAFELPVAKGWEFVRWLPSENPEAGSFEVRTTMPTANIDVEERESWKATLYRVVVTEGSAVIEKIAGDA